MAAGQAVIAYPVPATNAVSATAAVSTGVTLTIPAAGAGLFNYITHLEITELCSTAIAAGSAAPILVTTTGITGTPTFSLAQPISAVGALIDRIQISFGVPLKGSAANTAATIVAPVSTGVIWRLNAFYYVDV
jgi:hypothetical protein